MMLFLHLFVTNELNHGKYFSIVTKQKLLPKYKVATDV